LKSSCKTSSSNNSINTEFTFNTKEEALSRSESLMHNKRQQMHRTYCKEIADEIIKYNHVLLFGPINTKEELHNYLNK
jgi:stalled ribosome rescue protein Dom34